MCCNRTPPGHHCCPDSTEKSESLTSSRCPGIRPTVCVDVLFGEGGGLSDKPICGGFGQEPSGNTNPCRDTCTESAPVFLYLRSVLTGLCGVVTTPTGVEQGEFVLLDRVELPVRELNININPSRKRVIPRTKELLDPVHGDCDKLLRSNVPHLCHWSALFLFDPKLFFEGRNVVGVRPADFPQKSSVPCP